QERLFVANLDVTPHQEIEQLAIRPQIAKVQRHPWLARFNCNNRLVGQVVWLVYVVRGNARFLDAIHFFAGAQTHSVPLSAPLCVIVSPESKLILRSSALLLNRAHSVLDGLGI